MRTAVVLLAALACTAVAQDAASQLWPVPQSVACVDGAYPVASSFFVTTNDNSATLNSAIGRYSKIYSALIADAGIAAEGGGTITSMSIGVLSSDESLSPATNYTYAR